MKKYTISILTYKAFPMVKSCIDSVLRHSAPGTFDLILTNNGNTTGAREYFDGLARSYPEFIRVVHNDVNEGFIKPNNYALTQCETPYFVLLNDDARVPQGWLEALEKPFEMYPKAALSGLSGGCQSLNEDFHGRHGPNFEYLEGSCLMCRTDLMKKHGLFSPYIEFAYGEDSDLSLRMRQLGYTLHKVDLRLDHARAQTAQHIHNIRQIQARNHKVLCRKWGHYLRLRKFDYITVVRRWAALGDVLLVTAIVKKLREKNPLSEVIVETQFPELFDNNPYVKSAVTKAQRAYDMLYINLDMAYENRNQKSILDAYAEAADVETGDYETFLHIPDEDVKFADGFLPKGRGVGRQKWVAVHTGPTTWQGKNWPDESWRQLLERLRKEHKAKVVLVGHGDTKAFPCDRDIRGVATAARTAAVIAQCDLFIGLDSFPLHIAQAVKTPCIGLFGVTKPEMILIPRENSIGVTGDQSLPDYGRRHAVQGQVVVHSDGACMKSITVDAVEQAVEKLMPSKTLAAV